MSVPAVGLYLNAAFVDKEDEMAATTMDPLLADRYHTWVGFTRLIRYALAAIIAILILMAIFLL